MSGCTSAHRGVALTYLEERRRRSWLRWPRSWCGSFLPRPSSGGSAGRRRTGLAVGQAAVCRVSSRGPVLRSMANGRMCRRFGQNCGARTMTRRIGRRGVGGVAASGMGPTTRADLCFMHTPTSAHRRCPAHAHAADWRPAVPRSGAAESSLPPWARTLVGGDLRFTPGDGSRVRPARAVRMGPSRWSGFGWAVRCRERPSARPHLGDALTCRCPALAMPMGSEWCAAGRPLMRGHGLSGVALQGDTSVAGAF